MGYKLSETSALVLLWLDGEIYESATAKRYLAQLDLTAGRALYETAHKIWPHYAEVIKNRKFGVLQAAAEHFSAVKTPNSTAKPPELAANAPQVVIAGAGLDAMGLELAARYPNAAIFELDMAQMELKRTLANAPNLRFVTADIADAKSALNALLAVGFNPAVPPLLILEGISYYVSEAQMAAFVCQIAPASVIADLYLPDECSNARAQAIGHQIFAAIAAKSGMPRVIRYDPDKFAHTINMQPAREWTMRELEKSRTSQNAHFKTPNFHWITLARFVP